MGRFRFYHCGEYGSQNLRPHYHALLFGHDFHQDRILVQETPYPKYRSATLEEVWGLGRTEIGDVTYESAAYCARYVNKSGASIRTSDVEEEDPRYLRVNPETGEYWHVSPEYSTMSRRPGIGSSWLEEYHQDVYPSDEVVHNGRKFPVPRYYDDRVQAESFHPKRPGSGAFSDLVEASKEARRRSSMSRKEDMTPERLAVRERSAVSRLRLRRREL